MLLTSRIQNIKLVHCTLPKIVLSLWVTRFLKKNTECRIIKKLVSRIIQNKLGLREGVGGGEGEYQKFV